MKLMTVLISQISSESLKFALDYSNHLASLYIFTQVLLMFKKIRLWWDVQGEIYNPKEGKALFSQTTSSTGSFQIKQWVSAFGTWGNGCDWEDGGIWLCLQQQTAEMEWGWVPTSKRKVVRTHPLTPFITSVTCAAGRFSSLKPWLMNPYLQTQGSGDWAGPNPSSTEFIGNSKMAFFGDSKKAGTVVQLLELWPWHPGKSCRTCAQEGGYLGRMAVICSIINLFSGLALWGLEWEATGAALTQEMWPGKSGGAGQTKEKLISWGLKEIIFLEEAGYCQLSHMKFSFTKTGGHISICNSWGIVKEEYSGLWC